MVTLTSSTTLHNIPKLPINKLRVSAIAKAFSITCSVVDGGVRTSYEGVTLSEKVDADKARVDSWISSKIAGISRARVQSSIRAGLVSVNGRVIDKVSYTVKTGDDVNCTIAKLQPLRAEAEEIPLDIVYEDEHVLVVNKPPHMVVHPAPGNPKGTLVNAILNHCSLPNTSADIGRLPEVEDIYEDDFDLESQIEDENQEEPCSPSIRPGIVHRLDKGTSGLLIVAKDEHSHAHLAKQFKSHTINRVYISLTCGLPSSTSGRVEIPIGRDLTNRIRMTAVTGPFHSGPSRHAASRYKVLEVLANGGAAVIEWKLETGRTHQIRAHAKYLGIPLLGDDLYGGTKDMALSLIRPKTPASCHAQLVNLVSSIQRPCLHAMVLGFEHPCTGKYMHFSCPPPTDFAEILSKLRNIGK
ncbi:hypothetical protein vseg_001639 [Gypsophila vaccaria]